MKFGIISTANIGTETVIPAIQETEHEVVAIASRNRARAQEVAEQLEIPRAYETYEELLDDDEIEAVYNPLPNALHAEWTKRAADHGLHVLCEKPLAVDAAEARELGRYCDERGVTLMEAFMYRYHPRTRRAAELCRELDIRSVKARFQFVLDEPNDVRFDPDLAGGSLMDVGSYAVNIIRLFLGEPEQVYATTTTMDNGVETELTAILEYEDGVTAEISSSFTTQPTQHCRIEATNGWLEATEPFLPQSDDGTTLEYQIDDRRATEYFDHVNQYVLEIEQFADYIETGSSPETDSDDATRTMEIIDALYQSARENRPVSL